MKTIDLWQDLLDHQMVITREEVEFEIALSEELLKERESLIWKLFHPETEVYAVVMLKSLYLGVVEMIERRGG